MLAAAVLLLAACSPAPETRDAPAPSPAERPAASAPAGLPTSPEPSSDAADDPAPPAQDTEPEPEKTYAETVVSDTPIVLKGDDILEITDSHFIHNENISLEGNARLIIRGSLLELRQDYAGQHGLVASGNSRVVFEDSELQTSCTGTLNWTFFDSSSHSKVFVENSLVAGVRSYEYVEVTVSDTVIDGNVLAHDDSRITLIRCTVENNWDPDEDGRPRFGNVRATGNSVITLIDTVVEGDIVTEDGGEVIVAD